MIGAKMWKQILHAGFIHSTEYKPETVTKVRNEIITAPIIVDTRPRDDKAEAGRPWRWDTFKKLSVPFETFWVEGQSIDGHGWGVFTFSGYKAPNHMLTLSNFCQLKGSPPRHMGTSMIRLTDGDLNSPWLEEGILGEVPKCIRDHAGDQAGVRSLWTILDNYLDVLWVMGAKNVSLEPRPIEMKPREVKHATRKFGELSYKYHTLVVRPAGAKSSTPSQDIGFMPRHMCRGHFSEYGPDFGKGLLFGRLAGRFYIAPHQRGNAANGIVEKDYAIPAGSAVAA